MKTLRIALSLIWFVALLAYSESANDYFIQWAYRYGVFLSMAAAFVSGWLYFWVGTRLIPPEQRPKAASATAFFLVPLLALLGWRGVQQLWASLSDPDYFRMHGVGPVNLVAYLAQSAGILAGWLHDWGMRRRRRGQLDWIEN